MIHPRIDELLDKRGSRYALVIVAAKRARQINNYHHQLGEGTFDQFLPRSSSRASKNYLTMALEEVSEGKIKYAYRSSAGESRSHARLGARRASASSSPSNSLLLGQFGLNMRFVRRKRLCGPCLP